MCGQIEIAADALQLSSRDEQVPFRPGHTSVPFGSPFKIGVLNIFFINSAGNFVGVFWSTVPGGTGPMFQMLFATSRVKTESISILL
jgi:hypothetical protein